MKSNELFILLKTMTCKLYLFKHFILLFPEKGFGTTVVPAISQCLVRSGAFSLKITTKLFSPDALSSIILAVEMEVDFV